MSRPAPPGKSWVDLVKGTAAGAQQDAPKDKPAGTPGPSGSAAPAPKVVPQPAKPLPASDSTKAVQPCFDSIADAGFPMGFKDAAQFEECMQELCDIAAELDIECESVGVRGSAATYTSSNPDKTGQHFDSRGPGTSDIDAFLVSDSYLKCKPSPSGFFHPSKVNDAYPALRTWSRKWSRKLGRPITPGVHRSDAEALEEPHIYYVCNNC